MVSNSFEGNTNMVKTSPWHHHIMISSKPWKKSFTADRSYRLSPTGKVGPSEKRIEPKIGSTSLRTSCCSTGGKLDRRRVINPVTFSLPLCQSSYFIQLWIFLLLPPLPVSSLDFWTCSWGHCNTQRPAYSPLATKGHTTLQLLFCKYLQSLFYF